MFKKSAAAASKETQPLKNDSMAPQTPQTMVDRFPFLMGFFGGFLLSIFITPFLTFVSTFSIQNQRNRFGFLFGTFIIMFLESIFLFGVFGFEMWLSAKCFLGQYFIQFFLLVQYAFTKQDNVMHIHTGSDINMSHNQTQVTLFGKTANAGGNIDFNWNTCIEDGWFWMGCVSVLMFLFGLFGMVASLIMVCRDLKRQNRVAPEEGKEKWVKKDGKEPQQKAAAKSPKVSKSKPLDDHERSPNDDWFMKVNDEKSPLRNDFKNRPKPVELEPSAPVLAKEEDVKQEEDLFQPIESPKLRKQHPPVESPKLQRKEEEAPISPKQQRKTMIEDEPVKTNSLKKIDSLKKNEHVTMDEQTLKRDRKPTEMTDHSEQPIRKERKLTDAEKSKSLKKPQQRHVLTLEELSESIRVPNMEKLQRDNILPEQMFKMRFVELRDKYGWKADEYVALKDYKAAHGIE